MKHIRLIILAIAVLFALALGVSALVSSPPNPSDDVIIIKGGSLEVQCGKNHGTDCLGTPDAGGKYKHKKGNAHIMQVVVKDNAGATLFNSAFDAGHQPSIEITYK